MSQEAVQKFSSAVDKMLLACRESSECKEVLIGKLAQRKQRKAVDALHETIEQLKDTMGVDDNDIDVKNYRAMQDAISAGLYKVVQDQYWKMDTSPRESIPDEVDEWLKTCKTLSLTI